MMPSYLKQAADSYHRIFKWRSPKLYATGEATKRLRPFGQSCPIRSPPPISGCTRLLYLRRSHSNMADTIDKGLPRALVSRPSTKAKLANKPARLPNGLHRFVFKCRIFRARDQVRCFVVLLPWGTVVAPVGIMAIKIRARCCCPSLPFSSQ